MSNNKPSGILTTKADFYIYMILYGNEEEVYRIPVNVLKEKVSNTSICRQILTGGKNMSYIINKKHFKEYLISTPIKTKCLIFDD